MGHDHDHGSCDHGRRASRRSLTVALCLTLGFMGVEAVGGWLTGSLALVSDAGHMLTDGAALSLSLVALKLSELPPTETKTYGYRRFEILAALLNGLALWTIVGLILHEAWDRLNSPAPVDAKGMLAVAGLGLVVNLASVAMLHRHRDENLNVRSAFLHLLADSLGSAGALSASFVILATGWTLVDPLVSVGICGLILWSSWGLVREALHVLLEGVPRHIDYREVERTLLSTEGVCCLYDLHIWSIAGGHEALSAHVVVPDGYAGRRDLLRRIVEVLRTRFGINHATIQIEESHDLREEVAASTRGGQCIGTGSTCNVAGGGWGAESGPKPGQRKS